MWFGARFALHHWQTVVDWATRQTYCTAGHGCDKPIVIVRVGVSRKDSVSAEGGRAYRLHAIGSEHLLAATVLGAIGPDWLATAPNNGTEKKICDRRPPASVSSIKGSGGRKTKHRKAKNMLIRITSLIALTLGAGNGLGLISGRMSTLGLPKRERTGVDLHLIEVARRSGLARF